MIIANGILERVRKQPSTVKRKFHVRDTETNGESHITDVIGLLPRHQVRRSVGGPIRQPHVPRHDPGLHPVAVHDAKLPRCSFFAQSHGGDDRTARSFANSTAAGGC
jgi:hypothetical protein